MLKVANLIEDGRIAGPQLRILTVAKILKAYGVETTVIHPVIDSQKFTALLRQAAIPQISIPIHRLSRNWLSAFWYFFMFPTDVFLICRALRRGKFAFVHCSGGFWQIKGLLAANLAGCRAIWHMNDTLLPGSLRLLFFAACRLLAYRVIFAGQRVRSHYLNGVTLKTPTVEIHAPVDCLKFDPSQVVADPAILGTSAMRVVTVANLNPLKGLEDFIQMADLVSRQVPAASFHVIGPVFASQSKYFISLVQLVRKLKLEKKIEFHGPSDDIPAILKAADIYVCSSITEASPTSVWEAMAMEKAIVSTDVGDVAKFFESSRAGLIVPIRNPAALATAVIRFAADADMRKIYGKAARRLAVSELDVNICAALHMLAYT